VVGVLAPKLAGAVGYVESFPMAVSEELRRAREEIVVEHMESENRHEFDVTLGTFDHPRYELIGTAVIVETKMQLIIGSGHPVDASQKPMAG